MDKLPHIIIFNPDQWRGDVPGYVGKNAVVAPNLDRFAEEEAVFLFSDHGDYTGDFGIVEKTQNTFEDFLTRAPFLLKPPQQTPIEPRVADALSELVNFSAAVYDLTGIDSSYDSFGRSLLPVVSGETDAHNDAAFCEGGRRYSEVQALERESVNELYNLVPKQHVVYRTPTTIDPQSASEFSRG